MYGRKCRKQGQIYWQKMLLKVCLGVLLCKSIILWKSIFFLKGVWVTTMTRTRILTVGAPPALTDPALPLRTPAEEPLTLPVLWQFILSDPADMNFPASCRKTGVVKKLRREDAQRSDGKWQSHSYVVHCWNNLKRKSSHNFIYVRKT